MALLIRLFIRVIALLPLPVARLFGRWLGYWAWRSNSRGTRTARINLTLCFPALDSQAIEDLVRRSMQHWGMTIFEVPVIWRQGAAALKYMTWATGQGLVDEALKEKKGLIVLAPHLGNWELAGYWLTAHAPSTFLYQPPRLSEVDDIMREGRGKAGAKIVPTTLKGVSALIKALKAGEVTGILPDMEPDSQGGIFAPFFGVPTMTITLVHSLYQRSGAKILMVFCARKGSGFELHVLKPDEAIYDSDPQVSVAALNRGIEQLVQIAPEQYQWEYKRFKQRPPGEEKIYPKG